MGTLRNFNENHAVELTKEQFLKIVEIIKNESMFIQFKLKNQTQLELFKFEYKMKQVTKYDYSILLKHFTDEKTDIFFILYPITYTHGIELNIEEVTHDGYKINNLRTFKNINEDDLINLLPDLWFDIEFFNDRLK